jgi:hypothetical protein
MKTVSTTKIQDMILKMMMCGRLMIMNREINFWIKFSRQLARVKPELNDWQARNPVQLSFEITVVPFVLIKF